jgi:hypothetical protein
MKKNLFTICLLGLTINLFSQNEKAEALFLYNFGMYIIWPDGIKTDNYTIGVIGNDQLSNELNLVCNNKTISGKKIIVKNFTTDTNIEPVNILVVGDNYTSKIHDFSSRFMNNQTLIVSEKEGMYTKGSEICFKMEDNKLKFELSLSNIMGKGLYVDKRLIDYAIVVD